MLVCVRAAGVVGGVGAMHRIRGQTEELDEEIQTKTSTRDKVPRESGTHGRAANGCCPRRTDAILGFRISRTVGVPLELVGPYIGFLHHCVEAKVNPKTERILATTHTLTACSPGRHIDLLYGTIYNNSRLYL